jgi:pilus assembly protein CpaF
MAWELKRKSGGPGDALAGRDVDLRPSAEGAARTFSEQEKEWKQRIYTRLLKVLDLSLIGSLEEREARLQIRQICDQLMAEESAPLSLTARQRVIKQIEDEVMGLGPLEPLLADPTVSDILVNGARRVYVERQGKLSLTDVHFNDDAHLMNIIDRIVSSVGRRIDEQAPMVDARLRDGSRVNAIIPPLALDGPVMSIRRFSLQILSMDTLVTLRTLTPLIGEMLTSVIKARLNVLVSGGTGTGKTTLLNILSGCIPPDERIVTIEDSAELQLQQPHVVRLETRPANIEGRGEITQRDLVRNSLRMRPDRIIVGEVRGPEALDMLQAMNTGHDGSLTTVHANTARDALARVENMVSMTGISFPTRVIRTQIAAAIDVVLQVERHEDGKRRLVSIQEIVGMEGDIITMSELFRFERRGIDENGNVIGEFRATGVVPRFRETLERRGIACPLELFNSDRRETWA